jgi:hypothetical protein
MKLEPDIWQEYDCPQCGIDFDIAGEQILAVGERFYCSGCGEHHTAGEDGPKETMVRLVPDGELTFRDLPKDAPEKAAWQKEVEAARLETINSFLSNIRAPAQ